MIGVLDSFNDRVLDFTMIGFLILDSFLMKIIGRELFLAALALRRCSCCFVLSYVRPDCMPAALLTVFISIYMRENLPSLPIGILRNWVQSIRSFISITSSIISQEMMRIENFLSYYYYYYLATTCNYCKL